MKKDFSIFNLVLIFSGGGILLFIIAPLLGIFLNCSGSDWINTVSEKEVQYSILRTLLVSMAGTLLFSIFAVPFAYFLARKEFPLKRVIVGIVDLPVIIPHSAAGIALLGILSRDTFVGSIGEKFGFSFVGSYFGIAIAMAFVSIPFLINGAREGFSAVPENLEKTALTLGASPVRVFFTISLPLAWKSVLSGLIMMWARGLSEFGAVIIIAYYPMITPIMIWDRFSNHGLKYSRPVAAIFIVICLLIFIVLRLLSGRKRDVST